MLKPYSTFLCIMSLVAFTLYLLDKSKARNGHWRISEKTLLCLSFFGGGIGGYLGMFVARHKIRKWYFHAVNLIGIAWQVALLIFLL